MGIFKTEVEKAQLEVEKNKAIVDKYTAEQTAIAQEKQREKDEAERVLREKNRLEQLYHLSEKPVIRFLYLVAFVQQHPTMTTVNSDGTLRKFTYDELITNYKLKDFVAKLNDLVE
jgi:hypothetical protein